MAPLIKSGSIFVASLTIVIVVLVGRRASICVINGNEIKDYIINKDYTVWDLEIPLK